MENNTQTELRERETMQLLDTYSDEYWAKKYGVSSDELKEVSNTALSARIIEINKRDKALQA